MRDEYVVLSCLHGNIIKKSMLLQYDPFHYKMDLMLYAASVTPDQPGH